MGRRQALLRQDRSSLQEAGLQDKVTTRQIAIPGLVVQNSGDLQESLPGWTVLVGPREASDLEDLTTARLQPGG